MQVGADEVDQSRVFLNTKYKSFHLSGYRMKYIFLQIIQSRSWFPVIDKILLSNLHSTNGFYSSFTFPKITFQNKVFNNYSKKCSFYDRLRPFHWTQCFCWTSDFEQPRLVGHPNSSVVIVETIYRGNEY